MNAIKLVLGWLVAAVAMLFYLPVFVAMCGRAERMSDDTGGIGRAVEHLITLVLMLLSLVPLFACGFAVYALWSVVIP